MVVAVMTFTSEFLELKVIGWLLKSVAAVMAFSTIVIFQPEIRQALARLGSTRFFSFSTTEQRAFLDELTEAVIHLSKKRFGALFAIERNINLEDYSETGVFLDGELSSELTATIFFPKTALHDGGMVIAQERVEAAGCVFPVSHREMQDRSLGLRHRAGLGISEETDALAIVVSEETGSISLCLDGTMERDLTEAEFRARLLEIFISHGQSNNKKDGEALGVQAGLPAPRDRDVVSD